MPLKRTPPRHRRSGRLEGVGAHLHRPLRQGLHRRPVDRHYRVLQDPRRGIAFLDKTPAINEQGGQLERAKMAALQTQLRQLLADLQKHRTARPSSAGLHHSSSLVCCAGQTSLSCGPARPGHEHAEVTTEPGQSLVIGVLALQGAYDAHVRTLTALGATPMLVRTPDQLDRTRWPHHARRRIHHHASLPGAPWVF